MTQYVETRFEAPPQEVIDGVRRRYKKIRDRQRQLSDEWNKLYDESTFRLMDSADEQYAESLRQKLDAGHSEFYEALMYVNLVEAQQFMAEHGFTVPGVRFPDRYPVDSE